MKQFCLTLLIVLIAVCILPSFGATNDIANVASHDGSTGDVTATVMYRDAEEMINLAYLDILGRYPDESGLRTFMEEITVHGRDDKWLRESLCNSPEGVRVKHDRRHQMLILIFAAVAISGSIMTIARVLYRHRKTTKEFVFKICMMVAGILLACLLVESLLRVKAFCDNRRDETGWNNVERAMIPAKGSRVVLRDIIRLSSDPAVIYELMPGLSVDFMGGRLTTDDSGFRVTPYSSSRTNAFCIAGLGDSVMMGWGGNDEDTYLSVLARKQWSSGGDKEVRIVNMAVPGYNTAMEVERFKLQGLPLHPKLVLIHYVENDLYLPNFIREDDHHARLTSSYLIAELSQFAGGRVRTSAFEHFVRPGDVVPRKYKFMVGESGVQNAMKELIALGKTHEFKLVIITNWALPDFLKKLASGRDVQILELGAPIGKYCQDHKIETYQGSELTVSSTDPHYSKIGHAVVAEALNDCLIKAGYLP